jgi:HEAT repeat protein
VSAAATSVEPLEAEDEDPASHTLDDALRAALGTDAREVRAAAIREASEQADPEALVALMGDHADSVSRNAAMDALTRGGARSLSALVRALRHPDAEVVMFAAGVLGKTRDRAAIPHLVGLLTHLDVNVVQQAIESLAQLRSSAAVNALLATLEEDPWLRFAAIHALGEIGDERAVGPLSGLLSDETVRDGVIEALGKIGSPAAIEHLARALRAADDEALFEACLHALGNALDRPPNHELPAAGGAWDELRSEDAGDLHRKLIALLTAQTPPDGSDAQERDPRRAAAALIRALRLRSLYSALVLAGHDGALRETLTFYAVSLGDEIVPALRLGLSVSNANVRRLACECLGALAADGEDASIGARLADDDPVVREAALRALARMPGDRHAYKALQLLRDPHEPVRRTALETLARLDPRALTALVLASKPRTATQIASALEIMSVNPHGDQRAFIEEHLGHESPAVRAAAVHALAAQRDGGVVRLAALVQDSDDTVRRSALMAIAATGSPLARRILMQTLEESVSPVNAAHALGALGDESVVPALARLLAAPAPAVRRGAVVALGYFVSPTVIRHVAAAAFDADVEVRRAVARVLASSDLPAALSTLERLCLDPDSEVAEVARRRLADG